MARPIVVIGIGEIGAVFATGLLRTGHPVIPINRGTDPGRWAQPLPKPEMALVTVAEADLPGVLDTLPEVWLDRVGLVQNELLPRDWTGRGIESPTVISVWFEKKPGRPIKVVLPSPVFGPGAALLVAALDAVDVPARVIDSADELTDELVRKNVYILVSNIAGLVVGGTTGELWADHRDLALDVAADVLDIQEALVGHPLDRDRLVTGAAGAFAADPDHGTKGRSAPARLTRALAQADELGLDVPRLRQIQADVEVATPTG